MDTQIIWTLWHVPLVSLLTRFHCMPLEVAKLLVASSLRLGCVRFLCWTMSIDPCIPYMTLVSINVISNWTKIKIPGNWPEKYVVPKHCSNATSH